MAEEGGLPTWGSANVNTAIVVSLGAGLATGIGGAVAFVPQIFASVKQGVILSVALAISAGVMLYVSFIEIFVKAQAEIEKSLGPSGAAATTTACFFAGMLFCVVLELLVHKCMGHGRAVPPSGAATSGTDGGSPGEVSVELGNVSAFAQNAKALTDGYAAVATSEVEQKAQLKKMGALTAVAIALHNFPEGLATFMATVDDPSMGVALGKRANRRNSSAKLSAQFSCKILWCTPLTRHRLRVSQGSRSRSTTSPRACASRCPSTTRRAQSGRGFCGPSSRVSPSRLVGSSGLRCCRACSPSSSSASCSRWSAVRIWTRLGQEPPAADGGTAHTLTPRSSARSAGMMVFIVLHALLPTAHRYMPARPGYVTFFLAVGMVVMAISLVLFAI